MRRAKKNLVSLTINVAMMLTFLLTTTLISQSSLLNRATAGFIVSTSNNIRVSGLYLQHLNGEDLNELKKLDQENVLVTIGLVRLNEEIRTHWWKALYYSFKYGDDLQGITNRLEGIMNNLSRLDHLR